DPLVGIAAGHRGGIGHCPVCENRLPGKERTRLFRPVADRNDEGPVLGFETGQAARSMPTPIDPGVLEDIDRIRVDPRSAIGSRALSGVPTCSLAVQERFGNLTPRRVARAEKQHSIRLVLDSICCHVAGFRARMNAPLTRPPTSLANTSVSSP